MTLDEVKSHLKGVRKSGEGIVALCPAHEDKKQSLSVKEEKDKLLIHCHAGCSAEAIVSAMGLRMADLFNGDRPEPATTRRRIIEVYCYCDERSELLYQAVRLDPKGFYKRKPDGKGGWINEVKGVRRVLYQLPALLAAPLESTVFIPEGEKDVDRLYSAGLVATCNDGGAGKWSDEFNEFLRDRSIVILPDNDEPGRRHAEQIARSLHGIAAGVKIVNLPGLGPKEDVSDWLDAGNEPEHLCQIVEDAPEWSPEVAGQAKKLDQQSAERQDSGAKPTGAALLVHLVRNTSELFHDLDGNCYCTARTNGHSETFPLESKTCRTWLSGLYFHETGEALSNDRLSQALATLQAIALFKGAERETYLRLTGFDGAVYLDLCDQEWNVVKITANGWNVIPAHECPVRFIRRAAMQPLPIPVQGGSITELRSLLNPGIDDESWALIVSFLVMCLHPSGPYPILALHGEQGSAKTTNSRMIRRLIDPNKADLRSTPKEERDLIIAGSNSWMLGYDNLSGISPETSDALCRITTGAGFSTRELYSNSEEAIFSVKRPVIVNGIEDTTTRSDLLDRAVIVNLPPIPDTARREEAELWTAYEQARPRILGALLTAASSALGRLNQIHLERMPRMADFTKWAVAAEPGLKLPAGTFLRAYSGNREASHIVALEQSPAIELREFIEALEDDTWTGLVSDLHKALTQMLKDRDEDPERRRDWPKKPQHLSNKLKRVAPDLRAVGVDIRFDGHTKRGSQITIRRISPQFPKSSSPSSQRHQQGLSPATGAFNSGDDELRRLENHRHRSVTGDDDFARGDDHSTRYRHDATYWQEASYAAGDAGDTCDDDFREGGDWK